MNTTEFVKAEIADFRAKHLRSEGWSVHFSHLSTQQFLPVMPAFLRKALPEDAYEEDLCTDVGIVSTSMRITALPRFRHRKGIYEDDWFGEIRLTWHGAPLHFRRLWILRAQASSSLTLIATKDMAALEDFWKKGLRFTHRRGFRKEIMVINGLDLKRPKVSWDDVILPDEMKRQIRENFEAFLKARAAYKALGLPYRRGFLFMGPPGNGKSLVGKVIASEYRVNMVTLHLKSDLDETTIDRAFSRASGNPPCVLFLEDLDKMVKSTRVSLAYLLGRMDGLSTPEGIIIIATTNRPELLDPALLHRPSRFDRVWEFKLPGFEQRLALLGLRNKAVFSAAAIERAAKASAGFSMAYVQEAIVSAQLAALHAGVSATDAHLDTSVAQLRTQIKDASHGCKPIGSPVAIGFTE